MHDLAGSSSGGDVVGPFGEALGREGGENDFDVFRAVVYFEDLRARGTFACGELGLTAIKHIQI